MDKILNRSNCRTGAKEWGNIGMITILDFLEALNNVMKKEKWGFI